MRGVTHLAFGMLCSLSIIYFLQLNTKFYFVLVAAFASIFPDIDESKSILGKRLLFLPILIKHRGITHTPLFMVTIAMITKIFFPTWVVIAFLIGYLSHLLLDTLTRKGIMWFWPIRKKISGPFKTGKLVDGIILVVSVVSFIFLGQLVLLN